MITPTLLVEVTSRISDKTLNVKPRFQLNTKTSGLSRQLYTCETRRLVTVNKVPWRLGCFVDLVTPLAREPFCQQGTYK